MWTFITELKSDTISYLFLRAGRFVIGLDGQPVSLVELSGNDLTFPTQKAQGECKRWLLLEPNTPPGSEIATIHMASNLHRFLLDTRNTKG